MGSLLNDMENTFRANWMIGLLALILIFSHWMYLFAGFLLLIPSPDEKVTNATADHTDHTENFEREKLRI